MAWSSGTFSRVHDWTTDAAGGVNIEASRMDAEDDNLKDGIDACLHKGGQNAMTGNLDVGNNAIVNALSLEIQDSGATDTVTFSHDGTDFNIAGVNTTDINITGVTAIAAGTVDADFDAITATSYGGITEANLLDKTATETIAGAWTFDSAPTLSTALAVASGGTGASTASGARTALGVAIGSDVQAWDAQLDDIAALAVTNGNFIVGNGTNWVAESGATARTSLGLGSLATLSSVNDGNWSGTDLAVANGGTGSSTASAARTALGVAIGSDVQAWDAQLDDIAGLAVTNGNFIVGNGTAWVAESGATARTSLGVGTGDSPTFTGLTLSGSSFDPGSASLTTDNDTADEVGFKGAPQNIQNGSYTLVLTDAGKQIYKASGGAGETITIPANSSVAFPIGTIIEIINDGGGDLSVAITTDTLEPYGDTAGTQTLPDNHKAIIEKVTSTLWKYQATG